MGINIFGSVSLIPKSAVMGPLFPPTNQVSKYAEPRVCGSPYITFMNDGVLRALLIKHSIFWRRKPMSLWKKLSASKVSQFLCHPYLKKMMESWSFP